MERESYEFVREEDEAVGSLIAGLPRVEAPSDFEMRVRARIASGRTAGPSWLTPLVRVAVPAALLLTIGGYLGYYTLYETKTEPVADVITAPESKPAPPSVEGERPIVPRTDELVAESSVPRSERNQEDSVRNSERSVRTDDKTRTLDDQALTATNPILPRGLDTNVRRVPKADASVDSAGISAKDIFGAIGISASYTANVWKVSSVTANSTAEKSGVKAGDIIEALNDEKLTGKTMFGRTFTGTSLRIRRDGQSIKLDLKP